MSATSNFRADHHDQRWVRLAAAHDAYERQVSPAYDEALVEVAARPRSAASGAEALGSRTRPRAIQVWSWWWARSTSNRGGLRGAR